MNDTEAIEFLKGELHRVRQVMQRGLNRPKRTGDQFEAGYKAAMMAIHQTLDPNQDRIAR